MENNVKVVDEEKGGILILHVSGRLDASTSPLVEKDIIKFIDAGSKQVVLDFAGVDYLSSAGMRLLLASTKKIKAIEGKLVVCSLSDMVLDVIKMAGFNHILDIQPDEETALKQF